MIAVDERVIYLAKEDYQSSLDMIPLGHDDRTIFSEVDGLRRSRKALAEWVVFDEMVKLGERQVKCVCHISTQFRGLG